MAPMGQRRDHETIPREVRWFQHGDGPDATGTVRRRTDAYLITSLTPSSSLKRRGRSGPLEMKARVGRVELVRVAGLVGFAERWVKDRIPAAAVGHQRDGWLHVDKTAWIEDGVELSLVVLGGRRCWSAACDPEDPVAGAWVRAHRRALTGAIAASFPAWLLQRVAAQPSTG